MPLGEKKDVRALYHTESQAGGRPWATWPTIGCEEQWRVASKEESVASGERGKSRSLVSFGMARQGG